jgi:hypothetical protein
MGSSLSGFFTDCSHSPLKRLIAFACASRLYVQHFVLADLILQTQAGRERGELPFIFCPCLPNDSQHAIAEPLAFPFADSSCFSAISAEIRDPICTFFMVFDQPEMLSRLNNPELPL